MTTWIVDNPDIAMEVLGFTLANPERQMAAEGTEFSTVEDSSGRRALIESRLDWSANDPHDQGPLGSDVLPEKLPNGQQSGYPIATSSTEGHRQ